MFVIIKMVSKEMADSCENNFVGFRLLVINNGKSNISNTTVSITMVTLCSLSISSSYPEKNNKLIMRYTKQHTKPYNGYNADWIVNFYDVGLFI